MSIDGAELIARLDRDFFFNLLADAAAELSTTAQSEFVFAAPLAARIKVLCRARLGEPAPAFDARLFGPVLFPDLSPDVQVRLKFRDFLERFPELVSVLKGSSGDKVKFLRCRFETD